jgi:hypothetical protein
LPSTSPSSSSPSSTTPETTVRHVVDGTGAGTAPPQSKFLLAPARTFNL